MNELVLANRAADWHRLKMLVLDSVFLPYLPECLHPRVERIFPLVRPGTAARLYKGHPGALPRGT